MFKIVHDEKQVSVKLSSFEMRWRQCAMSNERIAHHTTDNQPTNHQPPITVHLDGMTMFSTINNRRI